MSIDPNVKKEFSEVHRKIDKISQGLSAMYAEFGIRSNRSLAIQVNKIDILLQTLTGTVGVNTNKDLCVMLREISREINMLKRNFFDIQEQVRSLNQNINQEYRLQKEIQKDALMGISDNVNALESIVSSTQEFP